MFGRPIWTSGRSCDVLWDKSSRRVAITDWTGSNIAGIYIADLQSAAYAVPLEVVNIKGIVTAEELEGHCYFEALAWADDVKLSIRAFGHTDTNPSHDFCYFLTVDTTTGQATLVRKEDREDAD